MLPIQDLINKNEHDIDFIKQKIEEINSILPMVNDAEPIGIDLKNALEMMREGYHTLATGRARTIEILSLIGYEKSTPESIGE